MLREEWEERLTKVAPNRTPQDLSTAVDAAIIASSAAAIGLTWLLAEVPAKNLPTEA